MCKIIAICNQKGGVGKTNIALNLGIGIARKGKEVLLIDSDSQGSLTRNLGFPAPEIKNNLADIYCKLIDPNYDGEVNADDYILHHNEGVDLIPCNISLDSAEFNLIQAISREFKLKFFLSTFADRYDYIFIDCPPALSFMTINALTACKEVIIPMEASQECLDALEEFTKSYAQIRKMLNPDIKIKGLVFNKLDLRSNFTKDVINGLSENIGEELRFFESIPQTIRLKECASNGCSIFIHDPKGKATLAYEKLVEEVLGNA